MSQDTHTAAANDHHEDHQGHFIADWRMQVSVLVILLVFTALTVGFYNFEQWAESAFGIILPKWVNIAGAMSIATVKGILVAAFFMQLKYDKALNTFVMLFCLFCVALFLAFTMIDLSTREIVDANKVSQIQAGGTGVGLNNAPADPEFSIAVGPKVNTTGGNIVEYARLHGNENKHGLLYYRNKGDEKAFWKKFYSGHAEHRDSLDEHNYYNQLGYGHQQGTSDANHSYPRRGLTPGLFSDVDPASQPTESHDDGH